MTGFGGIQNIGEIVVSCWKVQKIRGIIFWSIHEILTYRKLCGFILFHRRVMSGYGATSSTVEIVTSYWKVNIRGIINSLEYL